jgi:hypothetical protein
MRAALQFLIAKQRTAEAALLWWRFTCSALSLWLTILILQGAENNSPQSPEGLEIQSSQGFKGVRANREGQCLLLLSDLMTHN